MRACRLRRRERKTRNDDRLRVQVTIETCIWLLESIAWARRWDDLPFDI